MQRPRVDAQSLSHFRNRLPGLRHDSYRPLAELSVVDTLPGCHDPNYPSGHGLHSRRGTSAGHFPNEAAALKCVYMAVMSLDPTGQERKRRTLHWKPALQAFDIAFDGRLSLGRR